MLAGCSSNPSFQEGDAQLKVAATSARLEILKTSLGGLKNTTEQIPSFLKEDPPRYPQSELNQLREYLNARNCNPRLTPEKCVNELIIELIEMANRADAMGEEYFGAKVTVQSLLQTINRMHAIMTDNEYQSKPQVLPPP